MGEQVTVIDGEVVSVVEHGAGSPRPVTFAAAAELPVRDLAGDWAVRPAPRTVVDELAELAAVRALAVELGGQAPAVMHRALCAGADPHRVAAAYGAPVAEASAAWHSWAAVQRRRWVTSAPGSEAPGIPVEDFERVATRWLTATQHHTASRTRHP